MNYRDEKNYFLFEIDSKSLNRTVVRNGKKGITIKVPHSCDKQTTYTLQNILQRFTRMDKVAVVDMLSRNPEPIVNLVLGAPVFRRSLQAQGLSIGAVQLQVSVAGNTITHRIFDGRSWLMLDELKFPGTDSSVGRFGMFVPGKDQVGLSHITFKPI